MDVNAPEFTLRSNRNHHQQIDDNLMTTLSDQSSSPGMQSYTNPNSLTPTQLSSTQSSAYVASYGPSSDEYQSDYILLNSVLTDSGSTAESQLGVSAVAFDANEELLWMGNTGGHVTSYYGYQLQRYTSFQVHMLNDIRHLLTGSFGLLSLTKDSLRLSIRRGLTEFTHKSELLKDMQCMTVLPSNLVLLGGHQKKLIEFDLERVKQVRCTEIDEQGCVIIRQHPKLVWCGDVAGQIAGRDPNTLKVVHKLTTHPVTLSDFDVHGNYLVSCGFSNQNSYTTDRFLKVYDLRMMRQITPISSTFPPYLVRFITAFSSKICVTSLNGHFQLLDTSGVLNPPSFIHQVELPSGSMITAFDVSSSCQSFAFSDNAGYVHLYGASNEVVFNNYSQPTEFADVVPTPISIPFDDHITPLSSIPMVYYNDEKLLSDWPAELCKKVYRILKPIDQQILNSMRTVDSIGYAPNTTNLPRNQMPYIENDEISAKGSSNKETNESIPNRYQLLEPNHNKISLDEYDFGRYNNSLFTALDSTLPNSYANNIIQTLYFLLPLRTAISDHLCDKEFCLTCELSFLFHMLDNGTKMTPVQANNFLRAFRTMPEASALSLIIPDDIDLRRKVKFPQLAERWIRFILHQLHSELSLSNEVFESVSTQSKSPLSDLFGIEEMCSYKCKCGHTWTQDIIKYPITLTCPDEKSSTFGDLLKDSLIAEKNISTFCDKCQKFQPVLQQRDTKLLPKILTINCGTDNDRSVKEWRNMIERIQTTNSIKNEENNKLPQTVNQKKSCRYGEQCTRNDCKFYHNEKDLIKTINSNHSVRVNDWLPMKIFIKLNNDNNKSTIDIKYTEIDQSYTEYELINVTSVIKKADEDIYENIVSLININENYIKFHKKKTHSKSLLLNHNWYLFNHFMINPVSNEEVTHLDLNWKLPSILIYKKKDSQQSELSLEKDLDQLKETNPITINVFSDDQSIAEKSHRGSITFTPLSKEEMPKKDSIVAMDAEFVTLNQQETEIRSDGTRSLVKPSQRSVARISCLRGDGILEGTPFIDDYISTQEQVVDFMTKFSGIQPHDLDKDLSSKHLTTLKSTYLKLRFLIDNGVKFVGHGLKNDFRVINLLVPQNQIIDTVSLFQSPHFKRMVSLRFLAWHFLGIKIQSDTHDSIEDARTALSLYRKYKDLEKDDRVEQAIEELYDAGRNSGWKVPE